MSQARDKLKQCSLFGTSTFQSAVLSNIPYTSLPAALADELFPLLLCMLFLQKYSFLVLYSYFPQRMKKEWTTVLLLVMYILNHFWGNILLFSML